MEKELRKLVDKEPLRFMWMDDKDGGFYCYDGDLMDNIVFSILEIIQHNWDVNINQLFSADCTLDTREKIIEFHRPIRKVLSFEEIKLHKDLAYVNTKVATIFEEFSLLYTLKEGEAHYELFCSPTRLIL